MQCQLVHVSYKNGNKSKLKMHSFENTSSFHKCFE